MYLKPENDHILVNIIENNRARLLQILISQWDLIQRHSIHLDSFEILLLLIVDIANIGLESTRHLKQLVLGQSVV